MTIQKAADLIGNSRNTVVLSGAGISTPSGIPDFRSSENGLWTKFDPMEVASLNTFRTRPEKFFEWIRPLLIQILEAQPNSAHIALSQLEQSGHISAVITQNIDGLHQKAGSKVVHEIHGGLNTLTCVSCYHQHDASLFTDKFVIKGDIPMCPDCGSILKPDAILFGEQLPVKTWEASHAAVRACDVIVVVGSSLEVMPVAGLPMEAVNNGAHLIIINQSATYIDERAEVILNDDVAVSLPKIADEIL